jgi:hypothetical protein
MSGVNVFSFDKGLLSYLEVGSRSPSVVCGTLVMFLCGRELTAEFHVEFIKVDDELTSALQGWLILRMYCDVQVVFFVGKERGNASGCTQSIVVSEFSEKRSGNQLSCW